jgi:hypothetical protein
MRNIDVKIVSLYNLPPPPPTPLSLPGSLFPSLSLSKSLKRIQKDFLIFWCFIGCKLSKANYGTEITEQFNRQYSGPVVPNQWAGVHQFVALRRNWVRQEIFKGFFTCYTASVRYIAETLT